jgi:hypothetical protein
MSMKRMDNSIASPVANYIDFAAMLPHPAMPLQAEAVITRLTTQSEVAAVAVVAVQLEVVLPEVL